MRTETSAGAVVVYRPDAGPRYLLIHDAHGNWGFPKGHVEAGETLLDTARREVREETGVDEVTNHGLLGEWRWRFPDGGETVEKVCHYFLFEAGRDSASPQPAEGISEIAWLPGAAARTRLTFDTARELLDAVEDRLASRRGAEA